MSLVKQLKIRNPLVWVRTDEPDRVIDHLSLILDPSEDLYMLDQFDGLMTYDHDQRRWLKVLATIISDGEEIETTIKSFPEALSYVIDEGGTFILTHSHQLVENLVGLLSTLYSRYRTALFADDASEIPSRLIMLSSSGDIPPELATHFAFVEHPIPGPEELAAIVSTISVSLGDEASVELEESVKAGLGLNENQFFAACNESLATSGKLSAEYINGYKKERIKAGGVLEIRKPKISLDDIGGLDAAKDLIRNAVWIRDNSDEAREYGLTPISKILLVGVPGTGKSAICEATASSLGVDLAKAGISQAMDKFIGESEKRIRAAFAQIRAMAPLVVWVDEFGADVSMGQYQGDGGTTARVQGEFLTGLQEMPEDAFLLAAANRIDHVAPEMLRSGRFDRILFVGLPTFTERVSILNIYLGERAGEHDLTKLAQITESFTGAEIEQLIKDTRNRISLAQHRHITTEDLIEQVPMQKNRLWLKSREMIQEMYSRALSEWDWASTEQRQEAEAIINAGSQTQNQTVGAHSLSNAQLTTFG